MTLARQLMQFIAREARRTSAEQASERGVFPHWEQSVYAHQGMHLRNAKVTSIPVDSGDLSDLVG